ncbi:3-isopropylmalate dehydratase small subunit [Sphingomonas sp.]|uniref:3-isopropylmalate dehydratase small subunit n=1 Tax=Sphingomonas sp. TaxID=28214 RepID=UPI00375102A2
MTPVGRITGRAYPLGRDNIDTDVIIAADHLKTISREGLGKFAFMPIRAEPGNIFDDPEFAAAPILIAGANFGCGSSREHAAWALGDLGIKAVIAASFSDIFSSNAYKNGLVAVALPTADVARLMQLAEHSPVTVDLADMTVSAGNEQFAFTLDPFRRESLMGGLDEIALTLKSEPAIAAYEARQAIPARPAA